MTNAAHILIVDTDTAVLSVITQLANRLGVRSYASRSGKSAIKLAKAYRIEAITTEYALPDMTGIAMMEHIQSHCGPIPFLLLSSHMTVADTVAAMRLGAVDVLEKPLEETQLFTRLQNILKKSGSNASEDSIANATALRGQPRSAAERWATFVMKGCAAEGDLKTVQDWARCIGVSHSMLRANCTLVGVQARDARNFTRLLRALTLSLADRSPLTSYLDVSDLRTLRVLLSRGRVSADQSLSKISIRDFLSNQQFIHSDNQGLRLLQHWLNHVDTQTSSREHARDHGMKGDDT